MSKRGEASARTQGDERVKSILAELQKKLPR